VALNEAENVHAALKARERQKFLMPLPIRNQILVLFRASLMSEFGG
jgi:hypothetical protein